MATCSSLRLTTPNCLHSLKKTVQHHPLTVAIVMSFGLHLTIFFCNWQSIVNFFHTSPKFNAHSDLTLELYEYKIKMQILRKKILQRLGYQPAIQNLEPGIRQYKKVSLNDQKLIELLKPMQKVINSLWQREDISILGRAVVKMQVKQGKISNYVISEWEGSQEFLSKLYLFLKKLKAVNFGLQNKYPIWFESEFSTVPNLP